MNRGRHIFQIFVLVCLLGTAAHGEFPPPTFPDDPSEDGFEEPESSEEYLKPQRRRKKPKKKPPKVVIEPKEEDEEVADKTPPFKQRKSIYLVGGLSSMSSSRVEIENSLSQIYLKDHFALGAFGEFQFTKIFGVEADFFYGQTPQQVIEEVPNNPPPGTHEETRKMVHWGGMAGFRAEYLFPGEVASWRPHLGVGYGLMTFSQADTAPSGEGFQQGKMSGFYLSLGVEVLLGPTILMFSDFATSVGAGGTYTSTGITGEKEEALAGPGYNRFRVGVSVKAFDWISIGGLFQLRSINHGISPRLNLFFGSGEQLMQFMAIVGAEL